MKKFLTILAIVMASGLVSCSKFGDTSITGTYRYSNGYTGDLRISEIYEFQANGNVYNKCWIGNLTPFDTDGCSLYYKLEGDKLTIYHGVKGWKKEVRHTPYAVGTYYGDSIDIEDRIFYKD